MTIEISEIETTEDNNMMPKDEVVVSLIQIQILAKDHQVKVHHLELGKMKLVRICNRVMKFYYKSMKNRLRIADDFSYQ